MLIIGVLDESDIRTALMNANVQFGGNLEFKRFDHAGKTRHGENKFNVTLTVKDSRKPGSRRSTSGRRIAAACRAWNNVHGGNDHETRQPDNIDRWHICQVSFLSDG